MYELDGRYIIRFKDQETRNELATWLRLKADQIETDMTVVRGAVFINFLDN